MTTGEAYKELGIAPGSSQDDIKKAFRRRAHETHPDKVGGDGSAFKRMNSAYETLKCGPQREDERARSIWEDFDGYTVQYAREEQTQDATRTQYEAQDTWHSSDNPLEDMIRKNREEIKEFFRRASRL